MSLPRINADPLLHSFYSYSRIPLWIYSEEGVLTDCYLRDRRPDMYAPLRQMMDGIWQRAQHIPYEALSIENELYVILRCQPEGFSSSVFAILGPILFTPCNSLFEMRQLSFSSGLDEQALADLVSNLHILEYSKAQETLRFAATLLRASLPARGTDVRAIVDKILRSYDYASTNERSDPGRRAHTSYREELAVLNCVRDGDLDRLEATYRNLPETRYGQMSSNPYRQTLYGIIANITLVTRYAIEGGMAEEVAFSLSDRYIQKLERARTPAELLVINEEMAVDFTSRVAILKEHHLDRYSPPIRDCIHYIIRHTREDLSLAVLSAHTGLTPKYLSSRFRSETKQTLHSYIRKQRILDAKYLLQHTDTRLSEISQLLNFSSQSYFNTVFKKETGMTPLEFRNQITKASPPPRQSD